MQLLTLQEYEKTAEKLAFNTKALIDGKLKDSKSGKTFETVNPATGKVITNITSCQIEDVDEAAAAARKAFESRVWSGMSPGERKSRLFAFADLIEKNGLELAVMESVDSGKPPRLHLLSGSL